MNTQSNAKQKIQSFGRALSSMVMPNIGAFIAWGLITALFIPAGWIPNEKFAVLVGPMISYLLPLLIGYTGGKNVHGVRGGVIGAVATLGIIAGAGIPMFLGAMIIGPLAGYILKLFDQYIEGKIPAGFEMLINNFSLGIIGALIAMISLRIVGPVVTGLTESIGAGVGIIVNKGLLFLSSIFIEPAKILFLNNAINHGVLSPMGLAESKEMGKSIFFLLETNPGPGLGVLLAYWLFAKGNIKDSAPGSIIIHFLGGIHEIYFPYVLMNPILVLAVIGGGISGIITFSVFNAGLVAAPSPGSIIALLAMTPKGGYFGVLAGVVISTAVSFFISSIFVKRAASRMTDEDLTTAHHTVSENKLESKGVVKLSNVELIVYACDAGMGSSAVGASMLGKKLKERNINILVKNYAINEIPKNAGIVVSHEQLTARAKSNSPNAYHISITDFLDMSIVDKIENLVDERKIKTSDNSQNNDIIKGKDSFNRTGILLDLPTETKEKAIRRAGELLVSNEYVESQYVQSMLNREIDVTTYIGNGLAIPHCQKDGKAYIKKSGVVVLLYPDGVDFGEEKAYIICGIAGIGDEHMDIIANLANIVDSYDIDKIKEIAKSKDLEYIYRLFK
ncbi:MAG: PTS mannitol transporter subunit IICBA [Fusobacteriaceae bacterium]|jgi:PTS system mannitol-specific IIC component|nr:PTS mannitol transporter subunit IICBA [Fusobacteriaceae bacterium]